MTDTIHSKLVEFHKRFSGAKKTGKNPHFGSEHFTLDDVVKATTPILTDLGLHVAHYVEGGELVTAIFDVDGNHLFSRMALPQSSNPQAIGSAVTYYKRYNLCALLNIAEADDDGNAAAAASKPKTASIETLAALKVQMDSMEALPDGASDFFKKHPIETLTEEQAKAILKRLKEAA